VTVDIAWKDGRATEVGLVSDKTREHRLRVPKGQKISVMTRNSMRRYPRAEGEIVRVQLSAGERWSILFA
jgi:hypothetical protein